MAAWKTVSLSSICEIQRGGSPRPIEDFITEADDGINWIKIGDVATGAKYVTTTKEKIRPEGAKRSREVGYGDFLLSNSMSFGRPYILRTSGCIHDGWLVLRYDKKLLTEDYLYHVLSSDFVYAQFVKFAVGAVVKNLNSEVVKHVKIPLPPLPEQRRIAAILDQADALRAKRREALAQLDSLTQSIFIEMFGDPVRNPKTWQIGRLGDHVTKIGSGSTPTGGDAAYKQDGISLIRSLNIHDGEFKYKNLAHIDDQQAAKLANVAVEAHDVLLNITGASVARVCSVPNDVLPARVNQHVMIVRTKPSLKSTFLERMLLNPEMKKRLLQIGGAGATREAITKAQAEELVVICPPIQLQEEFVRRLTAIQTIKRQQFDAVASQDALFTSLQHRAFRGEL